MTARHAATVELHHHPGHDQLKHKTVCRRHKHPFLSPPVTRNPKGRLSSLVQDPVGAYARINPFFDQGKVFSLLDRLETINESSRAPNDQIPCRIFAYLTTELPIVCVRSNLAMKPDVHDHYGTASAMAKLRFLPS